MFIDMGKSNSLKFIYSNLGNAKYVFVTAQSVGKLFSQCAHGVIFTIVSSAPAAHLRNSVTQLLQSYQITYPTFAFSGCWVKGKGKWFPQNKVFLHEAENANFHSWVRFKITMSAASPCFRGWNECLSLSSRMAMLLLRNGNKWGGHVTGQS